MKINTSRAGFIVAILLLFWGVVGFVLLRPSPPAPAPDLTFKTITGKQISLKQLSGRPVLVNFWASSCRICLRDMPQMVSLYQDFSRRGLEIIGVVIFYDPPSNALQVVKDKQIPYPVAIDILADAAKAFGNVKVTPTSFLINPKGNVVRKMLGEIDFDELRNKISAMQVANASQKEVE